MESVYYVGFCSIYSVSGEERDLLKEGNQYFIDTFQNIRNPISLIKTPLGAVTKETVRKT